MDGGAWQLQSMGSQRVGYGWANEHAAHVQNRQWEPAEENKDLYLVLCGDLNGKEIQKRGIYVYIWMINFAVQAETDTAEQTNYTPKKKTQNKPHSRLHC